MEGRSEKNRIRLLWEIEKFPHCLQRRGYNLMSQDFLLEDLMNTRWNLVLFPRGDDFTCVTVCLARGRGGPETVEVDYELSFYRNDDTREVVYETTNMPFSRGEMNREFSGFRSREEICGSEGNHFFTGWDRLTIQCLLWRSGEELQESKFLRTYSLLGFVACNMEWCLRGTGDHKLAIPLSKTRTDTLLCPLEKHELKIRVSRHLNISGRIKIVKRSRMELFVICKISIVDANGERVELSRGECFFRSGQTEFKWELPIFLDGGKIMQGNRRVQFPNDRLTLDCQIEFSDGRPYSDDSMCFCETPDNETVEHETLDSESPMED